MIKQRKTLSKGVLGKRTPKERIAFEKDWDRRYLEGLKKSKEAQVGNRTEPSLLTK